MSTPNQPNQPNQPNPNPQQMTIQVDPVELPRFLGQQKAQKTNLEAMLPMKRKVLGHLRDALDYADNAIIDSAEAPIRNLAKAFMALASSQITEYEFQISQMEANLTMVNSILEQLDRSILTAPAGSIPAGPPPGHRGGFRAPKV